MKLIIISGLSGSGKSIALHALEDAGYYCIDNLPLSLTLAVLEKHHSDGQNVAISVDARNPQELANFHQQIKAIKQVSSESQVVFIDADEHTLIKRFSETRRSHPLTQTGLSLREALKQENTLLEPVRASADLIINTSELTPQQFRASIRQRITENHHHEMDINLVSFGFKHGSPKDADFVFDVRCLPNPYWVPELREFCGRDEPIAEYLQNNPKVMEYLWQLRVFLDTWLPEFSKQDRSYFTFAIGCTGGKHRSVYMVEALAKHFRQDYPHLNVSHRQLDKHEDE